MRGIVAAALLLLGSAASAEPMRSQTVSLPPGSPLTFAVPASWRAEVSAQPGRPPTVKFMEGSGETFRLLVTVWQGRADQALPEGEELRSVVEGPVPMFQETAENKIEVRPLSGVAGRGYYFLAVDRAPAPGEWKNMTQGSIRAGDLMLSFTILTNPGQDAIVKAALEAVTKAGRSNAT